MTCKVNLAAESMIKIVLSIIWKMGAFISHIAEDIMVINKTIFLSASNEAEIETAIPFIDSQFYSKFWL